MPKVKSPPSLITLILLTAFSTLTLNMFLPSLANIALDLSGRYYLVFNADFPSSKIGEFDSELVEDFWQALAANALCNLHVNVPYGRNSHHISEAIFKGAARSLRMAVESDPRMPGVPSTKGTL